MALRALGHDQSLAANCTDAHPYTIGDVDYTATLFDASADLGDILGPDSAAVGYLLQPPDDRDDLEQIAGYILEWRRGSNIVSAELSALGRTPDQAENDQFGLLVELYFNKSEQLS